MDKMAFPLTISGLLDIDDNVQNFKWEELTDGIQIHRIYEEENNGASAALLKYSPGANVPLHLHTGFEHILILSGTQTDGSNVYSKGMLMVSKPGTQHQITSDTGCVVLAIWQSPVQFLN